MDQQITATTAAPVDPDRLLTAAEEVAPDLGPAVAVVEGRTMLTLAVEANSPLGVPVSHGKVFDDLLLIFFRANVLSDQIDTLVITSDG